MNIKTVINKIFDYLFPGKCACCGGICGEAVCPACEKELLAEEKGADIGIKRKTGADAAVSAYRYGNKKLTKAIFALKKKNSRALAGYFAAKLYAAVKRAGLRFDMITNAPRSGENTTLYGYDHVELVSKKLAALTNVKYMKCLAKKKGSAEQKTLDFEGRRKNSEGKYKVTVKGIPRAILIVDDVCTSGETLKECITMLRRSGAETVFAVVIANRAE